MGYSRDLKYITRTVSIHLSTLHFPLSVDFIVKIHVMFPQQLSQTNRQTLTGFSTEYMSITEPITKAMRHSTLIGQSHISSLKLWELGTITGGSQVWMLHSRKTTRGSKQRWLRTLGTRNQGLGRNLGKDLCVWACYNIHGIRGFWMDPTRHDQEVARAAPTCKSLLLGIPHKPPGLLHNCWIGKVCT